MAGPKKGARQHQLALVFLDEFGMMLQPTRRRTWALAGQTPIQKAWDRHDRLSGIGAVHVTPTTQRTTFYSQLLRENVTTENLIWFLTEMHRHFRRKIILIWDRWGVHKAAASYFEEHHPNWFQFEELPGYSPELNPVEQCWKHVKYDDLPNFIPADLDHLDAAATASLTTLHDDEEFLRSAFAYCQLPLSSHGSFP
jgi:transposase